MSEKEQEYAQKIVDALPCMSEFDKGYFLAKAEAAAEQREVKEADDGRSNSSR